MVSQPACETRSTRPLSIPIRNVSLPNQIVRRGVAISVGTPPQPLAFAATGYANNTYVFDETDNECAEGTSTASCIEQDGGLYDERASSSWSQEPPLYIATENHIPQPTTGDFFGTDTLQIGLSTYLADFPFGILRNSIYNKNFLGNSIGLSSNSTFMNSLLSTNLISSRTSSVFWGLIGSESNSQADGTLIFGGYDAGRISGENLTAPIQDPIGPPVAPFVDNCATGFQVDVSDITLDFPNGTRSSIFGLSHSSVPFCIDPVDLLISLPPSTESVIEGILGNPIARTSGFNEPAMLYSADQIFQGDLSVSFISGLDIKIPNSQLVVPDIYNNQDGQPYFYNSSQMVVRLDPNVGGNVNDMSILGQTFLSSAYLLVDYDQNRFTLWQADPTAPSNLVTMNSKPSCSNGTDGNSTTTTATASATPDASSQHSNKVGPIVGGVLGGVALFALALLFLFIYRKRHRKHHYPEVDGPRIQVQREKEPFHSAPAELHKNTIVNEIGGHAPPHKLPM